MTVRAKLMVGFGVLILMLLLMAYTGKEATDSLKRRAELSGDIAQFSSTARDMRIERLVYFLKADDAQAAKWLEALERTERQLATMSPRFKTPNNIELLKEAQTTMQLYRGFYSRSVEATREREQLRTQAGASGETINGFLTKVAEAANGENGSATERQKLPELFISVQKMRTAFRSYTASPSKNGEDTVRQAIGQVGARVEALRNTNLPTAEVQGLAASVAVYSGQLEALVAAQTKVDEAQGGITTSIATILGITDKMTAIQNELRTSDAEKAQQKILLWLTLSALLSVLAAWLITRSIVHPLKETVEIVEVVAGGDFTYKTVVTRSDELGTLQGSMLRMTAGLRSLISEMKDGVVQVASAAEELSAVTEQTSAGVNAQKLETEQIATAMQQMTATTHEVSRNAAQAVNTAQIASQLP
ncbi:Histidine kinase, HAMP region: chemotaxis sensory transducer [Pseudomonas caricapapayae]|uniref:Histidine kinase, HAMP region: chemotaxis sensory transducer n=2 Tax=Pseudomonas caricapapayae TaxID=46678 RepID=A0A3M6EQ83_9PSED|nr:Histidine kinase, HAMP region: chemotaxis sensory transducer [Pseudomonas caricapapayae]